MSNLSDLLPAGGGAKVITATASGNLATGQTVALQSNGTIKAVEQTSVSATAGSATTYDSGDRNFGNQNRAIAYDSTNDRVVIAYRDSDNSNYGTAVVGAVSGTSISFGSPVVYNSANTISSAPVFDENAGKVVIFYRDQGNSERGTAKVGTVSGTSISFGSAVVFNSGGASNDNAPVYDPDTQKIVNVYKDEPNSRYGTAIVGTVSGTSISFGSEVVFETADSESFTSTYDTTANKVIIAYRDTGNSEHGTAIVGTVSGTSISFGSAVVFNASNTRNISAVYDPSADKTVLFFRDHGDSSKGKAVVGTVSGTSISFGSATVYQASQLFDEGNSAAYFTAGNKLVVAYRINSGDPEYQTASVSGSTITFDSAVTLGISNMQGESIVYDSTNEKMVVAAESGSSNGQAQVFSPAYVSTNSNNFAGITNQAINNSASGEVVVEGGVITNGSLLPFAYSASFGSETVFENATTSEAVSVFDSSNNKVVIVYRDEGNSNYGTAIIGTVSGTGVSFGSPVVFNAAYTNSMSAAFDSSNNKIVIAYRDTGGSAYPEAIVGTVSGTSISFGTPVVIQSGTVGAGSIQAVFDTSNNKVVVMYAISGGSSGGAVGTVSGTSISFGSQSTISGEEFVNSSAVFDSNANKSVFTYRDAQNSDKPTAVVVTTSGTSLTFGTPVVIDDTVGYPVATFDSSNNKVVVAYLDGTDSNKMKAAVGTVSGTSISFGSIVTIDSDNVGNAFDNMGAAFDSNSNVVAITYMYSNTSGKIAIGAVSGTSISFSSPAIFNSGQSKGNKITFDSSQNSILISYRDEGNSNYGTSIAGQISGAVPNFTIGSTYYVQDNGTLSTTSSSVTAGKAIANTTLLLKG